MTYVRGEDIFMGLAPEATRNTLTDPTMWIPGRTPSGVNLNQDRTTVQETRGSGMSSQGEEIVKEWAEGDLEFNVRSESIGYLLLALFGQVSSTETGDTGVYEHEFTLLKGNPLFQSLSLALSKGDQQDYGYAGALVTALELQTPIDDLVQATASFMAVSEETHADYTPAFANSDSSFNHTDVAIAIADAVADLETSGNEKDLKEYSLSLGNNGRDNQVIGSKNPKETLAQLFEVSGSLTADFDGEEYHDIFKNRAYKAMRLVMERSDLTIGSSSSPKLEFIMPRVTFSGYEQDRPIDDISQENIDYTAHNDEAEGYGIKAVLTNEVTSYTS